MRGLFVIIVAALFCLSSCSIRNHRDRGLSDQSMQTLSANAKTSVKMIDSVYNFGQVKDGEKVVFSYRFENTGNQPLVISGARASCGCTVPEKPDQPIAPGEVGYIKVVFNSKGRVGPVHKEVTLSSNAEPAMPVLVLSGEVASN